MEFKEELEKLGWNITPQQEKKFELYYEKLIEVNQYLNLTAITDKEMVYRKHFLDSLELVRVLNLKDNFSLCDVGSGAGFPSVPLAILSNTIEVTIIDALNKRIQFLNNLLQELNLSNVCALHQRAEDYAKEQPASFDVVTARAVARLNILAELCLPLTKIGGIFIAMKGSTGEEELSEAQHAIELLGGKVLKKVFFELPEDADKRMIIVIKKIKETPKKYPRNFGKIKEKPL